jgi:hypothetical protein
VKFRRPAPQTLAVCAALTLLALVAVLTSPPDRPAFDTYASTDYGPGGYRAWAALLEREGFATGRFVRRPIELDDRIDTLVSAQPVPQLTDPAARTPADLAALVAWVRRGGRLVYAGRNAALTAAENQFLGLPYLVPDVGPRGPLAGSLSSVVGRLHALGTNRMLLVEHPGASLLSDGNGDVVVRYPLGRGEIVAVSDTLPFTNANIELADNARLAFLLGRPARPGGVTAFDDGPHGALIDRPWYAALPVPLRVALAMGGTALLLGLIGSALRGSPPMPLEPAREPSSAEFVAALAALRERVGAREATRDVLGLDARVETDAQLLAAAKLAYSLRKDDSHGGNGDGRRAAFAGRARARRRW